LFISPTFWHLFLVYIVFEDWHRGSFLREPSITGTSQYWAEIGSKFEFDRLEILNIKKEQRVRFKITSKNIILLDKDGLVPCEFPPRSTYTFAACLLSSSTSSAGIDESSIASYNKITLACTKRLIAFVVQSIEALFKIGAPASSNSSTLASTRRTLKAKSSHQAEPSRIAMVP
jgi:hypothetical protein